MVQLLESIKVISFEKTSSLSSPRFWLSPGTVSVEQLDSSYTHYSPDAFLPVEQWRILNSVEQELLCRVSQSDCLDISKYIGIVSLPDYVLEPFEALGVSLAVSDRDCQLLSREAAYQQAVRQLVNWLLPLSVAKQELIIHNINVNPPGLVTVTYDRVSNHYIGLHLDSWDGLPLEKRHLSTNRICVNLGLEERYLLFVNLTLIDMFHFLSVGSLDNTSILGFQERQTELRQLYRSSPSLLQSIPATSIRARFLQLFSDYPVIKVRISPGEAYIAPTENMIHDGCTLGKNFADVVLTIRGYLRLPTFRDNQVIGGDNQITSR